MSRASGETGLPEALWRPRVLIWTVFLVLGLAVVMTLAPGLPSAPPTVRLAHFGLVAFAGTWVALLTLGVLYAFRRALARTDPVRISWLAFGLLLASTWLVTAAAWWVAQGLLSQASLVDWLLRATITALTVGVLALGAFQTYWHNHRLQERVRRSELAALQARTNPHFLFNTLNTAIALARQRPDAVEGLLLDLGDLFRAALASSQQVALEDELALARKYLAIEALRFGARLEVDWRLPDPLPALAVPRLCIQPLVENAVVHGIEASDAGGRVAIAVRVGDDGLLEVRVSNPLPSRPRARRPGHSIGLDAVRERVLQHSGGRGSLEAVARDGEHVATVRLPAVPWPVEGPGPQATTR